MIRAYVDTTSSTNTSSGGSGTERITCARDERVCTGRAERLARMARQAFFNACSDACSTIRDRSDVK